MIKFFKKWQGVGINDYGTVMSPTAKAFFKSMNSTLKAELKKRGINLVEFKTGHYDCYGFCEKNGKYVYFSYDLVRYSHFELDKSDPLKGFLVRTAEGPKDYRGGTNTFCTWMELPNRIEKLLKEEK